MKVSKITLILSGGLLVALLAIINGKIKENELKQKINSIEGEKEILAEKANQNRLLHIDSMLIKGDYKSALDAYKQESTVINDDNPYVKLRIELARQFMKLSKETKIDSSSIINESKAIENQMANTEIDHMEKYDSLNFMLEKTKVQLERIKKQLQTKTFGKYLTFKNRKKHQLHYVGQIHNNKADGYGIALFDTGSRYEGTWKDNLRHGEGTFYWNDGQYYVGEYQDDKRSGQGTYFWKNGEKYVGNWENDQRNGQGIFYDKKGKIITSGIWKNDKLVEEVKKNKH